MADKLITQLTALTSADSSDELAIYDVSASATKKITAGNLKTDLLPSSYLDTDGSLTANSDVKIASQKATKTYADTKMVNPMTDQGDIIYGGSSGTPTRLAKGGATQVLRMNSGATAPEWATISTSGDVTGPSSAIDGHIVQFNGATGKVIKDGSLALTTSVGTPGSDTNIPTEQAVREAISTAGGGDVSGPGSSTDGNVALFDGATGKILKDASVGLSSYVDKALYNAHTILQATSDNTPAALTVGEQTVVGRATGGNITALSIDSDLSSVSANDDTVPSAKATKAALDTKLPLAGGTMTGDLQLGETDIKLDATLSGDEKWSGIVMAGTAGATLAVGDVCYLASSGKWLLNDGILDGTDTGFSKQLGICVLAASGDTEPTEMLIYGKIRSAAFPAFTVGSAVYLDDTAGDLVVAQPSTTNFAIRIVGYAITAEDLLWNPSQDYIIHI